MSTFFEDFEQNFSTFHELILSGEQNPIVDIEYEFKFERPTMGFFRQHEKKIIFKELIECVFDRYKAFKFKAEYENYAGGKIIIVSGIYIPEREGGYRGGINEVLEHK